MTLLPFLLAPLLGLASTVKADTVYVQSSEYANGTLGVAPTQSFYSSSLLPVAFNIEIPLNETSESLLTPGYIFIGPRGGGLSQPGMQIFDNNGSLVYMAESNTRIFKSVTYKGEDFLVYWSGPADTAGHGSGYHTLVDNTYTDVRNISVVDVTGFKTDFHNFDITKNNSALLTAYPSHDYDLSSLGGKSNSSVLSGLVQEVDIETNELLFSWDSFDHVPPSLSYQPIDPNGGDDWQYDYFHINSIDKDSKGNYLVSSRNTHSVYYIDGSSGDILWRLGGMNSSFTAGNDTSFSWQHDAQWTNNETQISIFDNDSSADEDNRPSSRGVIYNIDLDSMSFTVNRTFYPYNMVTSDSQGNVQIIDRENPDSNAFIGWGKRPSFGEYLSDGSQIFAASFGTSNGQSGVASYRAYRQEWKGYPLTLPAISVFPNSTENIYVSWNGATEVESFELYGSNDASSTTSLSKTTKTGFETILDMPDDSESTYSYYQVAALDSDGSVLGFSEFTTPDGTTKDATAEQSSSVAAIPSSTVTISDPSASSGAVGDQSAARLSVSGGFSGLAFASVAFGLFALL